MTHRRAPVHAFLVDRQHFRLAFAVGLGIEVHLHRTDTGNPRLPIQFFHQIVLPLVDVDRAVVDEQRRALPVDLPHQPGDAIRVYGLNHKRVVARAAQADLPGGIGIPLPVIAPRVVAYIAAFRQQSQHIGGDRRAAKALPGHKWQLKGGTA